MTGCVDPPYAAALAFAAFCLVVGFLVGSLWSQERADAP